MGLHRGLLARALDEARVQRHPALPVDAARAVHVLGEEHDLRLLREARVFLQFRDARLLVHARALLPQQRAQLRVRDLLHALAQPLPEHLHERPEVRRDGALALPWRAVRPELARERRSVCVQLRVRDGSPRGPFRRRARAGLLIWVVEVV